MNSGSEATPQVMCSAFIPGQTEPLQVSDTDGDMIEEMF